MQNHLSTFSFKKIIKVMATVAFIIFITFVIDRLFMPKYVNENIDGRITSEFYRQRENLDVIAFGSSTVYNAIVPSKLKEDCDIDIYLRANASQTLWQSYYLLKDSLISQNPSMVMLDVSFMKNGEEFIEEPSNRKCIEGMRPSIYKYQAIKASMYEEEHPETYFIPVFRYHSRWKELKGEDFKYLFHIPTVTDNGYIKEDGVAIDQHIYEVDLEEENALSLKYENSDDFMEAKIFPDKSVEYLDRFVDECSKKGIKVLLFKTPTYVNTWYKTYDKWLEDYVNHKKTEKSRDDDKDWISYVNFDDYAKQCKIVVSEDYIDDGEHLNHNGAVKFTQFLEDYLR